MDLRLYILIAVVEKNSGAFPYTRKNLVVSHSYENHLHVGQPRDVSVRHAKVHYNFTSRRFRDWQSPIEIVITYFSCSEMATNH